MGWFMVWVLWSGQAESHVIQHTRAFVSYQGCTAEAQQIVEMDSLQRLKKDKIVLAYCIYIPHIPEVSK